MWRREARSLLRCALYGDSAHVVVVHSATAVAIGVTTLNTSTNNRTSSTASADAAAGVVNAPASSTAGAGAGAATATATATAATATATANSAGSGVSFVAHAEVQSVQEALGAARAETPHDAAHGGKLGGVGAEGTQRGLPHGVERVGGWRGEPALPLR